MGINTNAVQRLYVAYFNRPGDPVGMAHWEAQLPATAATQAQLAAIAAGFSGSAEYIALYAGQSNTSIVNNLYLNLFGRAAESAGLLSWAGKLTAGTETFASIALQLTYSAQGTDATAIANKLTAANSFTTALDTAAEIVGYSGTAAATSGRTYLAAVTDVTATLTTSASGLTASVAAAVAAGASSGGTTFTLTTGVDQGTAFTGGSSNDTFSNGIVDFQTQANSTLKNVDALDGSTGTDILNIINQGTTQVTDALNGATIAGIETINVRSLSTGGAVTIAAGTGVTSINQDRGTTALVVTGLADGAQAGIIGNASVAGDDLTFGYKAGVTSGTLNVKDGVLNTTAAIILDNDVGVLTGLTINSTGAANALTSVVLLDAAGGNTASVTGLTINATTSLSTGNITGFAGTTTTITASGAATNVAATSTAAATGAVNLGTIENTTVATITASGLTAGGISATLNTNVALSVTGGLGDDYIVTGAVLTTGSVAAGTGTDTLEIAGATHVASAALGAKYTGFETLRLNATQDVSLVSGITALELKAMTSKTISNISATQAAAIKVSGTQTTGVVLTLTDATGTADAITLNLKSDTAATNVDIAGLSIIGVETLNIQANSGTSSSADITTSDDNIAFVASGADKLVTINVSGTNDVALVGSNITKAVTVNNTQTAGIFTTSGNYVIGSVINGAATMVNTLTAGTAEGIKYVGGSANDAFSITHAVLLADGTTDTTLTGGTGTDTLTISDAAATLIDAHFTNVTGMELLALSSTGATSLTSGGSFKTAYASGVTITAGTIANGSLTTYSMGLYDQAVTLTQLVDGTGASTASNVSITTGSAADTVTLTASGWVGGATNGVILVSTGTGADSITVTTGTLADLTDQANAVKIVGGTGADTISLTHVNGSANTSFAVFTVAAGDSTTTASDAITGFAITNSTSSVLSDQLDFANVTLNAYTATTATGFTAAELQVSVSSIGAVTFSGTSAAGATLAQKIAAVQSVVITVNGDTAFFVSGSDSYVFNNDTTADSVVKLVGVSTATTLVTAQNGATDLSIFIS